MSVKVIMIQTCDGCGDRREIPMGKNLSRDGVEQSSQQGGWREVSNNKHLCYVCVEKALNSKS